MNKSTYAGNITDKFYYFLKVNVLVVEKMFIMLKFVQFAFQGETISKNKHSLH